MLRIGTKAGYPDTPNSFYRDMREHVQYLEWSTAERFVIGGIDVARIPVEVVHAGHYSNSGFNPVDSRQRAKDDAILVQAMKAADYFGSTAIVVHPERSTGADCSFDNLSRFISTYGDKRIIVENMPCPTFFMVDAQESAALQRVHGTGLCLDVAHAACYAFSEGYDLEEYLRSFISLKPRLFHFSDTRYVLNPMGWCEDTHMHLGEGDMDWELIISLLPEDCMVTLETPMDVDGQRRDIELIRSIEENLKR